MNEVGCNTCSQWQPAHLRAGHSSDCGASFEVRNSYFHAALWRCPSCGAAWLEVYYEDFSNSPIESEWGERTWIWRPLTLEQVGEIEAARGTHSLDLDTLGT